MPANIVCKAAARTVPQQRAGCGALMRQSAGHEALPVI